MAWPKGKPRPDAFKKKDTLFDCGNKFLCVNCGIHMTETDYLGHPPGKAEYTCFKCKATKIIDF